MSLSNVNQDRCLVLDNVFDGTVEREDVFYLSVRNDLHEGSDRCGQTHQIHVDRECGRVYMRFDSATTADKAAVKWHQTTYQSNLISVSYMDTTEYEARFGALPRSTRQCSGL